MPWSAVRFGKHAGKTLEGRITPAQRCHSDFWLLTSNFRLPRPPYCLDAATIGPGSLRPKVWYSGWAGFNNGPSSATEIARMRILSLVGNVIVLALAGKSMP